MKGAENKNAVPELDPMDSTQRYYEDHATEYSERTRPADLTHLYDRFAEQMRPGARILDAGCGAGRDLRHLRYRGFQVMGIDASAALVKIAHEHSGAPCEVMRFQDLAYEHQFDGVWA